ncbi:hypothetical protein FACS189432_08050 [Bacteroidia bacterium]|nr:hypothetical protein FACS189426_12650 [Bacteroidia bacterium]GHT29150.1 hypothetical protein FACS189432_08050 [Bacteroidia bacterium]
MKDITTRNNSSNTLVPTEFLLYKDANGQVKIEIYLFNETIWLTQDKIAQLFSVDRTVVNKHLKNIFASGELRREATCAKIAQVQMEGLRSVTRNLDFYNLDAILSVGYRVNSLQATHFRIWANSVLKEYIIKGFAMNDERLKNPQTLFGQSQKFHAKQLHDYVSDFDREIKQLLP